MTDKQALIGENDNLHTSSITIANLENTNKQLLENQNYLHNENKKLQSNLVKLAKELEVMKKTSLDKPMTYEAQPDEVKLKRRTKLRQSSVELDVEHKNRTSLNAAIEDLDKILYKIKSDPKHVKLKPQPDDVSETIRQLTLQLELEQARSEQLMSQLRKERNDEEKGLLKSKIIEMKDKVTNLEVENTKLKFQVEQITDDLTRTQKQLNRSEGDLRLEIKKNNDYEDERDRLKQTISDTENDNLKLKKEMIEELNEANRAKRISVDTEIALQYLSEAYENKRRECMKYIQEIDQLNALVVQCKQDVGDEKLE